jgi:hypothetical protein
MEPGGPHDSFVEVNPGDWTTAVADWESALTLGYNARQETEQFINGNICDLKQGWPRVDELSHRRIA